MTHWCRIVMNENMQKLVENYLLVDESKSLRCMEISGNQWKDFFTTRGHDFKEVHYPEFDITSVQNFEDTYDVIIAEQVWEHLDRPYTAMKNAYQMLNEGGILIVTTPFLVQIHNFPGDYTRWTKDGLKQLFVEGGFREQNIKTDSWGNLDCILDGFYTPWSVFNPNIHSLDNQPGFPMVVWGIAVK